MPITTSSMAYDQQRIDSLPLFDLATFGQKVVVNVTTNLADTKHNKFDTDLTWDQISDTMTKEMSDLVEIEQQFDNSVKTMIETEKEIRRLARLSDTDEKRLPDISDIKQLYDQKLAETAAANEVNVEENENYKKLKELLAEFADNNEDDDDLQTLADEEERIPVDPFSKTDIENPVKNKKCGHIYDGDRLREVLAARGRNQRQRCPIVGCDNKAITLEDCEADHKTRALIQRLKNI